MTQLFTVKKTDGAEALWLIKWLLGAFLSCVLLIGGAWASGVGSQLRDHEKRVTIQEETLKNIDQKLTEIRSDLKDLKNAR